MRTHSEAVSMSGATFSSVHGPATGMTESAPPESFSMPRATPAADVPAEAPSGVRGRSGVVVPRRSPWREPLGGVPFREGCSGQERDLLLARSVTGGGEGQRSPERAAELVLLRHLALVQQGEVTGAGDDVPPGGDRTHQPVASPFWPCTSSVGTFGVRKLKPKTPQ